MSSDSDMARLFCEQAYSGRRWLQRLAEVLRDAQAVEREEIELPDTAEMQQLIQTMDEGISFVVQEHQKRGRAYIANPCPETRRELLVWEVAVAARIAAEQVAAEKEAALKQTILTPQHVRPV